METFKKSIELVIKSNNPTINGRKFVHLNHFGEPLLNPLLPSFIRYASSQNIEVSFSTNAVDDSRRLFSRELWRELSDAGLNGVIISCHVKSEFAIRRQIEDIVNIYYVFKPTRDNLHNWAGQVNIDKFKKVVRRIPSHPCDYETHNMFAITWNGNIASCCYDIEGSVPLTVDDILKNGFSFQKIPLCEACDRGRGDIAFLEEDCKQVVREGARRQEASPFSNDK